MNTYYDYINSFFELLKVNPPSSNAQLLYHTLLMEYNNARWQSVELHRTNSYIGGLCGLGDKALANARNELKQIGLIDFRVAKKKPVTYILSGTLLEDFTTQKQVKGKSKASQGQVKGRTYIRDKINIKDLDNNPYIPFEGKMGEKFSEWLRYKSEKKQEYKPTGLSALIKKVQENIDRYGEDEVIGIINQSIENNWQGLFFDKLERQVKKTEDKLDSQYEEFFRQIEGS